MAKTKPTPRKPIKARGALPAPKVAPERDRTPWHRKPKYRALMGLAALAMVAVIVNVVLDLREQAEARRLEIRAIEQFQRRVADLNFETQGVYEELGQSPGAFLAGELAQPDYLAQTENWIVAFRNMNAGIRNTEAPEDVERLQDAKALYIQGSTLYIDAAKIFRGAAFLTDQAERERATVLGRNTLLHAAAVYAMGDREMTQLRNELELNDPPVDPSAPQLPEEEIQLPETPPGDTGAGDAADGAPADGAPADETAPDPDVDAPAPAPAGPPAGPTP